MLQRVTIAFIGAALALSVSACSHSASSTSQISQPVNQNFFPSSEFKDLTYDSLLVPIFRKHLSDLDEPILYDRNNVHYAVRVTLLTPFYGDAVLRIEDFGGQVDYVYKRRPSVDAPDTRKNVDVTGKLSREDFDKLSSAIQREGFFSLSNKQNVDATDGTIWLLEVYDRDRYHVVYRIGPFSTPVQNIGRLAASLVNINIRELE